MIDHVTAAATHVWRIGRNRALSLDQPRIMGILNVTPDSFSDGGEYVDASHAVDAALAMVEHGACIIDVGGESTRPGSQPVDDREQIRRTLPVIEKLSQQSDAFISIDTTRAEVARAAIDAGALIINDTSAGRDDEAMLPLAASRAGDSDNGCGLILMHRRVLPREDSFSDRYAVAPDYSGDVVDFVREFLHQRSAAAIAAGINRECIAIDPGLGFGKSVEQNYQLIARTAELAALGYPIVSAASRKSFLSPATSDGKQTASPKDRVAASVAVSVIHYGLGVRLFRVHDVAAHAQALNVAARAAQHLA